VFLLRQSQLCIAAALDPHFRQVRLLFLALPPIMKRRFCFAPLSICGALVCATLVSVCSVHAQDYVFTGATSSDPTDGTNYSSGTAPVFGGAVTGQLDVNNGSANPLIYTSTQGTTVFSSYLDVGVFAGANSSFQMTGGNATFSANSFPNAVGFGGTNFISVSGGILNFTGAFTGGGGPDSLWLTNDGNGTFNLSGGTVNIAQELAFSRDGGTGTLNITGGVFNVQGATGTLFNGMNNGASVGTINLGLGNGVFEETASSTINLGTNFKVDFATGSNGVFSLFGQTAAGYDALITAGDFKVAGSTDTNLADYAYTLSGGQGTLQLATAGVPEPSAWAVVLLSAALGGVALRRRSVHR
jgi:hypothetical protein